MNSLNYLFMIGLFEHCHEKTRIWHMQTTKAEIINYENMSMQYTVIFHGGKNDNFQIKKCNIFHIFAQNIDCGYTLEPPH